MSLTLSRILNNLYRIKIFSNLILNGNRFGFLRVLSFVTVHMSFTTIPSDQTIREGDKTTFHCTATGNPIPKITWLKDGRTVATGNTLSFTANRSQSGRYWCLANNGLDLKINASALLDVQCKFENSLLLLRLMETGNLLRCSTLTVDPS